MWGMKQRILIAIAGIVLLMSCSVAHAGIGLGISPSHIELKDALRGGTYERTIAIFNTGDSDGEFALYAEGAENICDIEFHRNGERVDRIKIPAGEKATVTVLFKIKNDVPNGEYETKIYAASVPSGGNISEGMGAKAIIRIPSTVVISVTGTQILRGEVKSVHIYDTEVGIPLRIEVKFRNTGNVVAYPRVNVKIKEKESGILVDSFERADFGVNPGGEDTITLTWNTTDEGDYSAEVTVYLGDDVLYEDVLPFKIFPPGTLTRNGTLNRIYIEGEPLLNRMVKIIAEFVNTGEIDTYAQFKCEIYHNGSLIDLAESDKMFVERGKKCSMQVYYKITECGEYEIRGYVSYGGKNTDEKSLKFTVPDVSSEEKESGSSNILPYPHAALLLVLIASAVAMRRSREKNHEKHRARHRDK